MSENMPGTSNQPMGDSPNWQGARRRWAPRFVLKILLFVLIGIPLLSLALMLLWNWLMPAVFGLRAITFWQALGIFVLSQILFGRFRGRPGRRGRWDRHMIERWERMTPEERQKVIEGLRARARCGSAGQPSAEPKP